MLLTLAITIMLFVCMKSTIKKFWSSLCWGVWEVLWGTERTKSRVIRDVPQKQDWKRQQCFC